MAVFMDATSTMDSNPSTPTDAALTEVRHPRSPESAERVVAGTM
jgi:hypothetical protein